jgi:HAD superfamily hydrolase (TIGR01549 family)
MHRRGMQIPPHEVFVHNYHGLLRDSIKGICGVDGPLLEEIFEEFIHTEEHYYTAGTNDMYYADALDLLRRNHAAGLRQIIVSNRVHHHDDRLGSPRNLAQKPPLAGLIELVVCGDDNEFHKPDARMLDAAERALGLERDKLLVIGDQFVDAELAHNLKAQAVLVSRTAQDIPHLDKLTDGWQHHVTIVKSLSEVSITPLG